MVDIIFKRYSHGALILQCKVQYNPEHFFNKEVPSAVSLVFQTGCVCLCMYEVGESVSSGHSYCGGPLYRKSLIRKNLPP